MNEPPNIDTVLSLLTESVIAAALLTCFILFRKAASNAQDKFQEALETVLQHDAARNTEIATLLRDQTIAVRELTQAVAELRGQIHGNNRNNG